MKTRNLHYDIMRVVACLMIIGMHAPMPSGKANPIFLNITSYCFAPGHTGHNNNQAMSEINRIDKHF